MDKPKYTLEQESIDFNILRALENHATYRWGTITKDQIRKNLQTPEQLDSFVDSFLERKDKHKELHESSLDRNYLLSQARLL
ncbi:MAG TPA: hypothetical protein DIW86_24820 [Pseudomonas sp.]|nr:hypothetical protein [Pseudomonas sp.]